MNEPDILHNHGNPFFKADLKTIAIFMEGNGFIHAHHPCQRLAERDLLTKIGVPKNCGGKLISVLQRTACSEKELDVKNGSL